MKYLNKWNCKPKRCVKKKLKLESNFLGVELNMGNVCYYIKKLPVIEVIMVICVNTLKGAIVVILNLVKSIET